MMTWTSGSRSDTMTWVRTVIMTSVVRGWNTRSYRGQWELSTMLCGAHGSICCQLSVIMYDGVFGIQDCGCVWTRRAHDRAHHHSCSLQTKVYSPTGVVLGWTCEIHSPLKVVIPNMLHRHSDLQTWAWCVFPKLWILWGSINIYEHVTNNRSI